MTLTAFLLLLVSVFLHAGWNFLSKKQHPSMAFYAIASTTAMVIWLPGFFWFGPKLAELPGCFWAIWFASTVCEFLYALGLAYAYRRGDISLVYPLARALPVLLTAALTLLFGLGVRPGPVALAGMGLLSFGCLLMPFTRWQGFRFNNPACLGFILLAAAGTTGYTIFDSLAIREIARLVPDGGLGNALFYIFLIESGLAVSLYIAVFSSRFERAEFRKLFLRSKTPVISGCFSSSAYVLVLLAYNYVTNVSYIQAFRQMSLPLGVLAGMFLLHEKPGKLRLAGILLVIIGLIIVKIGA